MGVACSPGSFTSDMVPANGLSKEVKDGPGAWALEEGPGFGLVVGHLGSESVDILFLCV